MLALLNKYKWYAVAVAFLVYSVGVWNVSANIQRADFTEQELRRTETVLKNTITNQQLAATVSKAVQEALEVQRKLHQEQIKELRDELAKDPRYKSCTTTDSVRNNIQRKLNSQP